MNYGKLSNEGLITPQTSLNQQQDKLILIVDLFSGIRNVYSIINFPLTIIQALSGSLILHLNSINLNLTDWKLKFCFYVYLYLISGFFILLLTIKALNTKNPILKESYTSMEDQSLKSLFLFGELCNTLCIIAIFYIINSMTKLI
jgi:hypothetical protein